MNPSGTAAALVGRRLAVEVPATIANLGAGYDCLGMAIDLVLHVEVEALGETSAIELLVEGEGATELASDRSNRFVQALEAGLLAAGVDPAEQLGWRIRMTNQIPLSRGLGSSAAATVAGLLVAAELLAAAQLPAAQLPAPAEPSPGSGAGGERLATDVLLRLASGFEGHPDNVAPALLGGFVASIGTPDGTVEAIRFELPTRLRTILFIPNAPLSTLAMRDVLPPTVPRADAVANVGRVAIGVAGLASGRLDVLRLLTEDRLHEPYRAAAMPALPRLRAAALEAGAIGACLAGSGSSVIAFADGQEPVDRIRAAFEQVGIEAGVPNRVETVAVRNTGALLLPAP